MNTRPKATVAVLDLSAQSTASQSTSILDSALRKFDGLTVLEWSVRRIAESTMLDRIVVTGNAEAAEHVRKLCLCSASWMVGNSESSCDRAQAIAEATHAQWLVFVEPTCPFVDPVLLDRLISSAWGNPDCDYLGFFASKNPGFSLSRLGLVGEICHRRAIDRLAETKEAASSNCSVPSQIRREPDRYPQRLIPLPTMLEAEHMQFSIHSAEDCLDASLLLEVAGDDLSYQRLARISESNRHLHRRASFAS